MHGIKKCLIAIALEQDDLKHYDNGKVFKMDGVTFCSQSPSFSYSKLTASNATVQKIIRCNSVKSNKFTNRELLTCRAEIVACSAATAERFKHTDSESVVFIGCPTNQPLFSLDHLILKRLPSKIMIYRGLALFIWTE